MLTSQDTKDLKSSFGRILLFSGDTTAAAGNYTVFQINNGNGVQTVLQNYFIDYLEITSIVAQTFFIDVFTGAVAGNITPINANSNKPTLVNTLQVAQTSFSNVIPRTGNIYFANANTPKIIGLPFPLTLDGIGGGGQGFIIMAGSDATRLLFNAVIRA